MKYSILDFNQEQVLKIRKTKEVNGKQVEIRLDIEDLLILDYISDFMFVEKNMTYIMDGKVFYWVFYDQIAEELPILNMKKHALYCRFHKMVELGILEKAVKKDTPVGCAVFFRFSSMVERLKYTESESLNEKFDKIRKGIFKSEGCAKNNRKNNEVENENNEKQVDADPYHENADPYHENADPYHENAIPYHENAIPSTKTENDDFQQFDGENDGIFLTDVNEKVEKKEKGSPKERVPLYPPNEYILREYISNPLISPKERNPLSVPQKNKVGKMSKNNNDEKREQELHDAFVEFAKKYKDLCGKHTVSGIESIYAEFKSRHKDYRDVVPILLKCLLMEDNERRNAKARGNFFPEPKNIRTYLGKQRAWECYASSIEDFDNEAYRPVNDGYSMHWNEHIKRWIIFNDPRMSKVIDGYTEENRPASGLVYYQNYDYKWDVEKKKWVKQER